MGFPEFVVVIASIMALNPLAMDMMLPDFCRRPGQTAQRNGNMTVTSC